MKSAASRLPMALLVLALLFMAAVLAISHGLSEIEPMPFSVVIDGEDISSPFGLAGLDGPQRLVAAAVALVVALVVVVFVPLMMVAGLALVLLFVGGIVLAAVGTPLLVVALVLGLLLSPLILLVVLLRWLLR